MTIAEMQQAAWQNSENHGFHEGADNLNIPTKLMLIVSEASEALEELRDSCPARPINKNRYGPKFVNDPTGELPKVFKPEGFPSELADIVIRVGDLAGMLGIDLEAAVVEKMRYNESRPYKHGRNI